MTAVSLTAVEKACAAATPGPWWHYGNLHFGVYTDAFGEVERDEDRIAPVVDHLADAELIALSRTALPVMAKALRAVVSVCRTTDGDWLDGATDIPVGEVVRMLVESGVDLSEWNVAGIDPGETAT